MIAAAVQRVRGRAQGRTLIRKDHPADLLVSADPALFELVLVNVLDNAILYSDDGTRIAIENEQVGAQCRITIADEGHGIPEADLERVFGRFYRVSRMEPSPRGSGLGLAIAHGFAQALIRAVADRRHETVV